ncbi:MAG: ammonia channel protein, partial [Pseudonocardiaceae bacterium]|nr:ammonia channel protein [Pseudonocardiaceae bacterium]
LVGITPAANAVTPVGALLLGLIVGATCSLAVSLKYKAGYDDSLDVVGIHLVGGLVGTLLIGLIGSALSPAGVDGLLYGGSVDQLWRQAIGAGAVLAYSFVVTTVIALAIKATVGFRPDPEDESNGIDEAEHAESAYEFSSRDGSASSPLHRSAASPASTTTKERAEL